MKKYMDEFMNKVMKEEIRKCMDESIREASIIYRNEYTKDTTKTTKREEEKEIQVIGMDDVVTLHELIKKIYKKCMEKYKKIIKTHSITPMLGIGKKNMKLRILLESDKYVKEIKSVVKIVNENLHVKHRNILWRPFKILKESVIIEMDMLVSKEELEVKEVYRYYYEFKYYVQKMFYIISLLTYIEDKK